MHFIAICFCVEIGFVAISVKSLGQRFRRVIVHSTE